MPGTKSMRYRVGATKGHYVQGEPTPTLIDTGTLVITDQRAVFVGTKQNREWRWDKCLGVMHQDGVPWTVIAVSNRQKVSTPPMSGFGLDLASAVALGHENNLIGDLEDDCRDIEQQRPPTAAQPAAVISVPQPVGQIITRCDEPRGGRRMRAWTRSVDPRGVIAPSATCGR